jgi:hypothetical protein
VVKAFTAKQGCIESSACKEQQQCQHRHSAVAAEPLWRPHDTGAAARGGGLANLSRYGSDRAGRGPSDYS